MAASAVSTINFVGGINEPKLVGVSWENSSSNSGSQMAVGFCV